MSNNTTIRQVIILIVLALFLRIFNFSFPAFTADEARVAFRGYVISTQGRDELGRMFPVLFNSLQDYQLPMVSYLVASGELIFGKSEIGARIPFVIIGTLLVLLMYHLAKYFNQSLFFRFTSASLIAFSPTLIFLSRVPNETIVLTFLFTLLFYLFLSKRNIVIIIFTMLAAVLTSKQAWLILFPFILFILLFYQKSLDQKKRFMLIGLTALIVFLTFSLFLAVPQAKRSLQENNLLIFSDATIKNGIDRLRGQGIDSNWPPLIDRFLFNKGHFLSVGFLHWLSNLSPSIYFGQLDNTGEVSYSYLGTWAKILIVPFILGICFLLRKGSRDSILFFLILPILTFPSFLVYPNINLKVIVLILPFMALIMSFGFAQLNKRIGYLILFIMLIELSINIFNFAPEYKNTNILRPIWIEKLSKDIFEKSKYYNTAVSDDIVSDIVPYIGWHTSFNPRLGFLQVDSPYKYKQYQLSGIKIIGSDERFHICNEDQNEKVAVYASTRDLDKAGRQSKARIVEVYKDSKEEDRVYLIEGACI